MTRSRVPAAAAVLSAALLAVSCAPRRTAPPANIGYPELRAVVGDRDATPLRGRRILLDPGHGGRYRGVVGRDGLAEADVNLGVALWLRGLLEAAGAKVWMTRTADVDLLAPGDTVLADDLAARVALCDTLHPDVFVSLHHNSNAQLDRDLNETQTYYPVGRDGADLDLARAVHRHLVQVLRIAPAKIMAGNFYVLRNATVPAILGEPSMLSHPGVERKLSLARFQELEAQAYFLGLLDYFAAGSPRWEVVADSTGAASGDVAWRFVPDDMDVAEAPALDPTTVDVRVDGEPAAFDLAVGDGLVTLRHGDDAARCGPRPRAASIVGRNLAGRATPRLETPLPRTAVAAPLAASLTALRDARGRVLATWRTWPERSGWLRLGDGGGDAGRTLGPTGPGAYCTLMDASAWPAHPHLTWSENRDGGGAARLALAGGGAPLAAPHGAVVTWLALAEPDSAPALPATSWRLRALPGLDGWRPAERDVWAAAERPALPLVRGQPAWIERPGCRPLLVDGTHRTPWQEDRDAPPDTLAWQALLPALVGRTVVIDPAGGGADDDGLAPLGTPGRELNLRAASRLVDLLRGAGAVARLTRTDASRVPPESKILLANALDADLFVTLRRAGPDRPDWSLSHHPGSAGGVHLARLLRPLLAGLAAPDTVAVGESFAYLLRQTACPALDVALPLPATPQDEDRWNAPAWEQATASALFDAIAAWFAGDDVLATLRDPRAFVQANATRPTRVADAAWIRVDGNWLWLPPREGDPAAKLPLPGPDHTFEVAIAGGWELIVSAASERPGPSAFPWWTDARTPTNPFAAVPPGP